VIASGGTWDLGPGAVAAIGAICTLLATLFAKQARDTRVTKVAAHAAAKETAEVKKTLTENNGGSSVKDALDELRGGQRLIIERQAQQGVTLGEHTARLQSLEVRMPRRSADRLPPPPPVPKEPTS